MTQQPAGNPSVACLQEFWVFSEALLALYRSALEPAGQGVGRGHPVPRSFGAQSGGAVPCIVWVGGGAGCPDMGGFFVITCRWVG